MIYTKKGNPKKDIVNDTSNNIYSNGNENRPNKQRSDQTSASMEAMYDKNLSVTKGINNNNNSIHDVIQRNLNSNKIGNKYGENSPTTLSSSNAIQNENIINNIDNNGMVFLEYKDDDDNDDVIHIIIDNKNGHKKAGMSNDSDLYAQSNTLNTPNKPMNGDV